MSTPPPGEDATAAAQGEAAKAAGNAALKAKNWGQAVACYTEAICLDGSNHVYHSNRSAAHLGAASYEDAIADAEKCIQLAPTFAKGYGRKAAALWKQNRLADAARAYEAGLQEMPADAALARDLTAVKAQIKIFVDLGAAARKEEPAVSTAPGRSSGTSASASTSASPSGASSASTSADGSGAAGSSGETSSPAGALMLAIGSAVVLAGLVGAAQHNGKRGTGKTLPLPCVSTVFRG